MANFEKSKITLNKDIESVEAQYAQLDIELASKTNELVQTMKVIEETVEEMSTLENEIACVVTAQSDVESKSATIMEEHLARIRVIAEEKEHLEKVVSDLELEVAGKEEALSQLQQELVALEEKGSSVEAELEATKVAHARLEATIDELVKAIEKKREANGVLNINMKELSKLKIDLKMIKDDLSVSDER